MATVTIRNLDEAVLRALKERARRNGRSLAEELRRILADAVAQPIPQPARKAALRVLAERIAAMGYDVPQTDSVALLREDRDR